MLANNILGSLKTVITDITQTDVVVKNVYKKEDVFLDSEVSVIVGLVGILQGNVVISFDIKTAINIAGKMSGMEHNDLDDIVLSAIGEFGNMICGRILMDLAKGKDDGEYINITCPSVIKGTNMSILSKGYNVECIETTIVDDGDIVIYIMYLNK
jgi:chemotaxis protein CheX